MLSETIIIAFLSDLKIIILTKFTVISQDPNFIYDQLLIIKQINYLLISHNICIQQDILEMFIPDDPSNVQAIFNQLKQNLKTRQTHSLNFRQKALNRLVQGYEKMRPQFDEALKNDLGLNQFMTNFLAHGITTSQIKNLHDHLEQWMKPTQIKTPIALGVAKSSIQYQPLGLVLVISAWNYPIYTALPQVAAAIAAGNSVILKPSQFAPFSSKVLAKLFKDYLDQKYYRCIQGKVEVAKAVSKLPFDMICFTGSTTTGKSVALQAAKNLTPCLLQLGGKCPVIVDQTADIQNAVLRILFGKFTNCGQTCVGVDHVYVHQKIAENFKKRLLQKIKQGYNIQQIRQNGDYAKIIHEGHVQRLTQYLNQNHHGKVLLEGVIEKKNRFISPFVIENPAKNSLIMTEQIFGPILPIKTYSSLEKIVEQINENAKPLVVYVFSQKTQNVKYVKQRTSSGSFVVNDVVVQLLNPYLPFGGVGASGYGRYHGISGFQHFSNPRSICETKSINIYPLNTRFAPYTESKKRVMTFLLKIGGVTYDSIGKGFKYALIIASGIGLYALNKNLPPKL